MKARAWILPLIIAVTLVMPWSAGRGWHGVAAQDGSEDPGSAAVVESDEGTPVDTGDVEESPTEEPTATPTDTPTEEPTDVPTEIPTEVPTEVPSETPTDTPAATPSDTPTETPTATPEGTPSATPSEAAFEPAAASDIQITLNCTSDPEQTRIYNSGAVPLLIHSVSSVKGAGPYVVERKLGAGRTVIYRSGAGVVSGTILTTDYLYDASAYEDDGVILDTDAGPIEARCAPEPAPALSDITVTLNCSSDPETTRIVNSSDNRLIIYSIGSLYGASSAEPYVVNRSLGGGKQVTYYSGSGATSGTILTTRYLYTNSAYEQDGVHLETNAGPIEVRCAGKVYPSNLTVSISCNTSPERITIKNIGQGTVTLASLRTWYQPIAAEPFSLGVQLAPNQTITYQAGTGASANVLTSQNILNQNAGTAEGVTVTVSTGKTFSRACPPGERWIDVNLTTQYLTAYEGLTPVRGYYISSGRWPNFETPTGDFYINTKLVSQTMSGCLQGECYYVPDVPWVMYFTNEGHALHGAYWHNNFGQRMSHGCINQPVWQAEWLFYWASIGTRVHIHY